LKIIQAFQAHKKPLKKAINSAISDKAPSEFSDRSTITYASLVKHILEYFSDFQG
jgi:hypothetical protein